MRTRAPLVAACVLLGIAVKAVGQPPTAPPPRVHLTADQKQRLKERDQLLAKSDALRDAGKLKEALDATEKLLAVERDALGNVHEDVAATLIRNGKLRILLEDWAGAREACREGLKIRNSLFTETSWQVTDARYELAEVDRIEKMTPDNRARLRTAFVMSASAIRLHSQQQNSDAERLMKEALDSYRNLLGESHRFTLNAMRILGVLYYSMGRHGDAEPLFSNALAGRRKTLGSDHPATLTSINDLATLYTARGRHADAEGLYLDALAGRRKSLGDDHLGTLHFLTNLADLYLSQSRFAEAEPLHAAALTSRRKALGDDHPDTLRSMSLLARVYTAQGRSADAEPLDVAALAGRRKALGKEHPDTLKSLNNLAVGYRDQHRYADAEPLFKDALAARRRVLGNDHPDTLTSMQNLATLYSDQGRYADAEPLCVAALGSRRKALGDDHPDTLTSMSNLALLYKDQGRYADAEPLYFGALAGRRKALGKDHPDTLTSVSNLAVLYNHQGRHSDAETLFKDALAGRRKARGDEHPDTLASLHNLASFYRDQARPADAEPLLNTAIAGSRKAFGDDHPDTLTSMTSLALVYYDQGRHAEAERMIRSAIGGYRKTFGDNHPNTLHAMNNLAIEYLTEGREVDARALLKDILAGTRTFLDRTAASQTEGNQITFRDAYRYRLDMLLSVGPAASVIPADRYAEALSWKGAAFARRSQLRTAVERSGTPDLKALFAEAGDVARRLANVSASTPPANQLVAYRQSLKTLSERKDEIDRELTRKSEPFRKARETAALTPTQLEDALPPDVTVLDYLTYTHYTPDPDKKGKFISEERFLAYVVRNGRQVIEVELGPVKPIADAVERWRETINRTTPARDETDPAVILRKKVWEPVAKHLDGAKVVLISPDGALARLPFGALPGSDPTKYLLEEVAIATAPVPQLIPEMLGAKPLTGNPSLLLIGDVDYDDAKAGAPAAGTAARAADQSGAALKWGRLDATRDEVVAIRGTFAGRFRDGTVTTLQKGEATEAAVRRESGKHRFVHFATHGFFAPPKPTPAPTPNARGFDDRQAVGAGHPGLLSGLVFAGANAPRTADSDDGILTALEVAELDLAGVDLAVLSACETKLGKDQGSEGVLGLERAFRVAGARTTVTTLWQVSDKATEVLVVRFYRNLWDKKMSRLEALREAQLWMLRDGSADPTVGRVRAGAADRPDVPPVPKGGRLPPFYWAAFALSGDWR